ncbi:hypothetical protein COOONC_21038 [Cooperia oncophora]
MFDVMFRGKMAGIRNRENFTDEDLEAWKHVFSQKGSLFRCPPGPINYYRNVPNARPLKGEDRICKVEYCQHGQLKFIEGASHWVMQDEPSQVNQLVEEFLATPIRELITPSPSK